ncbi:DedA family protein [Streptomyces sp. NPDC100445]|uniref:DedA family protein n=1 Tax=Streptomyces sp. NPDC100445 TaxID=3366102 RepID=UPI003813A09E
MMTLALGPSWLDPNHLLGTYGIWGLLLVVFAESGLLIGFFLPGDSLLFTCGLLITSGGLDFPLWAAIGLICLAAILGDQAGYMFGKKVGPSLFNREDSRLFKRENVVKAHDFFEKYGPKSLVLARFVPVVRTFTPIVAGVSGMRYRSFLTFNVIGGLLWGAGVTLLGSWLGNIGVVKNNIEAILILIVLVSVVPIAIEFLRARGKSGKAAGTEPEAPGQSVQRRPAHQPYQQQPAHQQQPYQRPPVTDDATTRLRRIDADRPYEQQYPQEQYQQQYPQDPYQQQYPQDRYQQPQPPQQHWDQGGYDPQNQDQHQQQHPQNPYGQGQYEQNRYDEYDRDPYDPNQYPYDHRRQ